MKIAQVVNGFPPVDHGGVESYSFALSKALRARGNQVTVFCREPGADRPKYSVRDELVEAIPVRFVVNRSDPLTPLAPRYYDKQVESLFVRWLVQHKPDVVHFQHAIGLSASLIERTVEMGVAFVLTLHDYWFMCPQVNLLRPDNSLCVGSHRDVNCYECLYGTRTPPPGRHVPDFDAPLPAELPEPVAPRPLGLNNTVYDFLQRLLPRSLRRGLLRIYDWGRFEARLRLIRFTEGFTRPDLTPPRVRARYMRDVLAQCQCIIAPSNSLRARYVEFGMPEEQIRVIPHGMNLDLWQGFVPVSRPQGDQLRFGYVGSLLRHKGVDVIIRAFQRLNAPNTELRIHGFELPKRPFVRMLHEMADDDPRIRFAGPYSQPELPAILNQMDVLLIPARWHETFSLVTREAVLAGLPVIASRVGAIPEVVQDGVNGYLLPPDDVTAWTAALQRVVKDREIVSAFHQAQLNRKIKSMDDHTMELLQLYRQLEHASSG